MSETKFKVILGFSVAGGHLLWLCVSFALFLCGGFHADELTIMLAIMLPMTATYMSAVISYFRRIVDADSPTSKRRLSNAYVVMTGSLGGMFFVIVTVLIILKAFNVGTMTFDMLIVLIGVAETACGAYFGKLFFVAFQHS